MSLVRWLVLMLSGTQRGLLGCGFDAERRDRQRCDAEKLHETVNNIYAVVGGTARAIVDGQRVADEPIMAKFGLLRHGEG